MQLINSIKSSIRNNFSLIKNNWIAVLRDLNIISENRSFGNINQCCECFFFEIFFINNFCTNELRFNFIFITHTHIQVNTFTQNPLFI